ncbi:photosystem I reaction center subunit II chloroplastic [Prunus yedoensis var. nudiflora]|uniref:Photosystem I reaction center subunit II, chloroplastic n=1 Tax=Prunus yedoensis var. nudiflora TaxID=2094558 RepID=A0A314YRG3_PRUYE|nr:photosystem I reaction center subunit II chloroplastic [Prunus yedoensis var. nudiflora]
MATQATLFTPTLSAPKTSVERSTVPWKQSVSSLLHGPKATQALLHHKNHEDQCSAEEKTVAPPKEAPVGFTPPELDPTTPSPIFGGSTGGLLRKAQEEEFYVITWESPKEQIFEMPTGGAAIMREGPNLLKLPGKSSAWLLGQG